MRVALAVFASCMAMVVGCTSTSHKAEGTVTGTLRLVGGPAPGVNRPAPGTVSVFASSDLAGRPVATVQASTSGMFVVRLSAGTYYLAASSPRFHIDPAPKTSPCRGDKAAVVESGGSTHVDVICSMK
jgi:hypothetical protein